MSTGPCRAERARRAEKIAELLDSAGLNVAVAESLTGGMVASALAEAQGSSTWFRGAVVAYASDVKHELLDVPAGPVVSAHAAAAMADGVRRLLKADVAVALTGAAGPDGQDGRPPGTVFLAVSDGRDTQVEHRYFDCDDPADVCAQAVSEALLLLHRHLCAGAARST
ncbi:MAG: CinA family protein [Actinomycetota bacterium]|nr:CinA family protein [Actinomycetota bacterium]